MSAWTHGDTNLDEYPRAILENNFYALECVDGTGRVRIGPPERCEGHWYNSYPVGGPILTSPLIVAAVGVMKLARPVLSVFHSSQPVIAGFLRADYDVAHPLIEEEVASALLAATTVVIYFIARRYLAVKNAVILSVLFALATPAYSVAGRALWQHTPSMLLLSIIIYLLLRAEERPSLAAWAGIPVALSYTVRPTDALFVLVFTLYVAVKHRAYLLHYLLAAAPVAVAFLAYSFSVYRMPLPPYYQTHLAGFLRENWGRFGDGLAGNLISPGRGLLVYTPVFAFAIWSMVRGKWKTPLSRWLAVLVLLHWVVVSSYIANWWAGHSYGPRFFTDVTPVFVLFLIPYLEGRNALRTAVLGLALVGLAVHLRGGWSTAVYEWNVKPMNIDEHPERNWDWSDPPFLR